MDQSSRNRIQLLLKDLAEGSSAPNKLLSEFAHILPTVKNAENLALLSSTLATSPMWHTSPIQSAYASLVTIAALQMSLERKRKITEPTITLNVFISSILTACLTAAPAAPSTGCIIAGLLAGSVSPSTHPYQAEVPLYLQSKLFKSYCSVASAAPLSPVLAFAHTRVCTLNPDAPGDRIPANLSHRMLTFMLNTLLFSPMGVLADKSAVPRAITDQTPSLTVATASCIVDLNAAEQTVLALTQFLNTQSNRSQSETKTLVYIILTLLEHVATQLLTSPRRPQKLPLMILDTLRNSSDLLLERGIVSVGNVPAHDFAFLTALKLLDSNSIATLLHSILTTPIKRTPQTLFDLNCAEQIVSNNVSNTILAQLFEHCMQYARDMPITDKNRYWAEASHSVILALLTQMSVLSPSGEFAAALHDYTTLLFDCFPANGLSDHQYSLACGMVMQAAGSHDVVKGGALAVELYNRMYARLDSVPETRNAFEKTLQYAPPDVVVGGMQRLYAQPAQAMPIIQGLDLERKEKALNWALSGRMNL
ncbi:hypothetical protein CANCADRAFT_929 [Tortispora caseinolytica NRRL Y-17796]|uniref:Uncharacterized protein n=1 Tax=Tortispora caseinolytica NRRL Y-17796 TaxID=767744 RepID=A0A1E4TKR8_9ASCO|nr:hypothetical protein CANCADRAFT_929 [Tortispora caseinolytica NRRL Y-17796]